MSYRLSPDVRFRRDVLGAWSRTESIPGVASEMYLCLLRAAVGNNAEGW